MRRAIGLLCGIASSMIWAAPPLRIISLAPHATEMVAALAPERLIAVDSASDYPPAILPLPHIRAYPSPSIEAILALKPDLVVTWQSKEESRALASLSQQGIQVLAIQPQSPKDVAAELRQLGKLLQLENKAEALAQEQERRYNALQRHYAQQERVKVFLQISAMPLLTVSGNSFMGRAIRDCNGVNAFDSLLAAAPQVSEESVLSNRPDVMISTGNADLNHWTIYKKLPAVMHNRLYTLGTDVLVRPGPRLIEGVEMLCRMIDRARSKKIS